MRLVQPMLASLLYTSAYAYTYDVSEWHEAQNIGHLAPPTAPACCQHRSHEVCRGSGFGSKKWGCRMRHRDSINPAPMMGNRLIWLAMTLRWQSQD